MNIEFLVHGILRGGQAFWKDIDTDYCSRFYVPFLGDVKIDVEVIKQNGGIGATYYTYLRYNNVSAPGRPGSYFGMTVRVDDAICCDVINMYRLLDTIFNKCVVGSILKVENNKYVYACDSFKTIDADLRDIENKFGMMCGAMIFQKDYIGIPASYKRQTGSYNINNDDVTPIIARDALLGGNKLCVSPYFPTKQSQNAQSQIQTIQNEAAKQIKAAQEECAKQIQAKTQEMEQASKAASSGSAKLKEEIRQLKEQLKDKENELETVKADYSKQVLNAQINQAAKDLKEPIKKLAAIMAERFPEDDSLDNQARHKHDKKHVHKDKPSFVAAHWKAIVAAVVLLVLVGAAAWPTMSLVDSLKEKDATIKSLNDSIAKIQNPVSEVASAANNSSAQEGLEEMGASNVGSMSTETMSYDFSSMNINIIGKGANDPGLKKDGTKTYSFEIADANWRRVENGQPGNGVWKVNGIPCTSGKYIVVNEIGETLKITYSVNGEEKVSRTIQVIQ